MKHQDMINISKAAKINMLAKIFLGIIGPEKAQEYQKELVNLTFFMSSSDSKNNKTGKLPQMYGPSITCPPDCIFWLTGACYARNGHCKHWFNVAGGKAVKLPKKDEYKKLCQPIDELKKRVENIPAGALYRVNVSGDICYKNTGAINTAYILKLSDALQNLKPYTYTHCSFTPDNLKILAAINSSGVMTINKSCETLQQVESCAAAGVPAVLAVEKMSAPVVKKNGVTYIQCFAQTQGKTCKECTACQRASRKCCITFELHGQKSTVQKIKNANILIKEL